MVEYYKNIIDDDKEMFDSKDAQAYRAYWLGVYYAECKYKYYIENEMTLDEYIEIKDVIDKELEKIVVNYRA